MRRYATALLLMAAVGIAAASAGAKDECCSESTAPCCDRCGCHCDCLQKVCQVVCETKKEVKTCWCVECHEITLLMPDHRDCCDPCEKTPRCGRTKCVQKLVKKEYQVEKPCYKCVVYYVCPACFHGGSAAASPTAAQKLPPKQPTPTPAPLPPPPAAPAR